MFIFGTKTARSKDVHNIYLLINRIKKYICNNPIKGEGEKFSKEFDTIAEQLQYLINATYMFKWDLIVYNKKTGSLINSFVKKRFSLKSNNINNTTSSSLPKDVSNSKLLAIVAASRTTSFTSILPPPPINKPFDIVKKKTLIQSNIKKLYM